MTRRAIAIVIGAMVATPSVAADPQLKEASSVSAAELQALRASWPERCSRLMSR